MFTTRYSNASRLATLVAAVVLGLGLLAGCSEDPSAGPNAGHSTRPASDDHAPAARREALFAVPGMDCPMCPITVKRALSNVDGVLKAEANLETKQAYAVFNPSQTDAGALMAAIENAGFSAHLKKNDHE